MTLHEAIKLILIENNGSLSAREIADKINDRKFYLRADKKPVPASQVSARVSKYPNLFTATNGKISVVEKNMKSFIGSYIDPMPLVSLKSKLWSVFDILRGETISSRDYYIILFFLSLFKDRIITSEVISNKTDIKTQIEMALQDIKNDAKHQYQVIYQSFEPILGRLSKIGLLSILKGIIELDHKTLKINFPEVFDSVLYNMAQSQGRHGGEFIQPLELTRLICGLTNLPEGAKIFNPFAGLASFGVNFDEGQEYLGQELNPTTWALGALRIKAYERPGNSKYVCDDSILNWPDKSKKFDLIVSNPPYGLRLGRNQYKNNDPEIRTIEHFLIEKSLNSLTPEGRLIAVIPQGFLFRGAQEKRLRQFLVDEDLIDTIISLPSGLLLNTGIPLIILVIDKNKKRQKKIRFIKADKFVESRGPKEKILNDYALNSLIHSNRQDSDAVRIIDFQQIQKWDYNLNVPRYFQKTIFTEKNEKLKKLKGILEYVNGQNDNLPKIGKLVRIGDLKDDKVDFQLDEYAIEEIVLRKPTVHQLSESCLLLAVAWRNLKPTFFKFNSEPIYRRNDILSFKVDESIADYAYVINELHSDYVQEQLESYRLGSTIPLIRKEDLLNVVIKLPPLEEQRAKVQGLFEL